MAMVYWGRNLEISFSSQKSKMREPASYSQACGDVAAFCYSACSFKGLKSVAVFDFSLTTLVHGEFILCRCSVVKGEISSL